MDVRCKTFANRSSQDIRFDQLLRTKPLSSCPSSSSFPTPLVSKSSLSQLSSRKRVNVVSFIPGVEGQELITKSPEKPVNPDNQDVSIYSSAGITEVSSHPFLSHSVSDATVTATPLLTHIKEPVRDFTSKRSSAVPIVHVCMPEKQVHPPTYTITYSSRCANTNDVATDSSLKVTVTKCISSVSSNSQTSPVTCNSKSIYSSGKFSESSRLSVVDKNKVPQTSLSMTSQQLNRTHTMHIDVMAKLDQTQDPKAVQKLSLWRSSTAPVNSSDIPAAPSTKHGRSLFSGRNKRAAYNPRSWQKEIETEDSSPTKLLKVFSQAQAANTGSATSNQPTLLRTSASFNSEVKLHKPTGSMELNDQLNLNEISSGTRKLDNFAFPDSDDDYESKPSNNTVKRSTSLISHVSNSTTSNFKDFHDSDLEECNDDEEEEDDVKPWFRPASRDTKNKSNNNKKNDSQSANTSMGTKVNRSEKSLYTVLHKVSEAHVCQERGETQHLLDDVEYLLDGLSDHNQVNTRALSVLTLANKCLTASFRHTINAHGLLKRICSKLHDAHTDYTLALTSAGLLLILSRDRDPNVLDAESLATVLKLFSAPDSIANGPVGQNKLNKEAERVRTRVRQLLEGLHNHSHNINQNSTTSETHKNTSISNSNINNSLVKRSFVHTGSNTLSSSSLTAGTAGLNTRHLQMTRQLTTSDLIIETILNLGTRKAGDWFKAELRNGGGLDRVADAASDAVDYLADLDPAHKSGSYRRSKIIWRSSSDSTGLDSFALDRLKRVCHYTKLLENMTYMNSDNQTYLVRYRDGTLVNGLLRCLRVCVSHLPQTNHTNSSAESTTISSSTGVTNSNVRKPIGAGVLSSNSANGHSVLVDCVLGIFRFLVNVSHNEFASNRLGGCSGLLEVVFECLLKLPDRLPGTKRFDLLVLTLCLLVNLCEHCPENRIRIVHLEIPKPLPKCLSKHDPKDMDYYSDEETIEDEDNDDDSSHRPCLTSALDEVVQLFLVREERARNHDFERDDDEALAAAARRRQEQEANGVDGEIDSKPMRPGQVGATVEEAGLKWRLIEDRRALGLRAGSFLDRYNSKTRKKNKKRSSCRQLKSIRSGVQLSEDEDEDDANASDTDLDEELDEDCEPDDDDEDEPGEDEDDDDDDDESVGSGADVEFVADTQEEQEKLAERMSQAQQHMEDSVVAAYAALLLGCILQSSPRYTDRIRSKLPDGQFRPLAIMLAKLLSFLSLTKGVGSSGSESILRIVRILEAQDNNKTDLHPVSKSNSY